MASPYKDVFRLAALLSCLALATSRLGLVAHELVGHGGAALAVGAHVTAVHLFYFAGGWIRYTGVTGTAAAVAVAMGGITVELACAAALVWAARRRGDGVGPRLVRGLAGGLVVHATWYLATGAWHGYGDGAILYHVLGGWRRAVALAAGIAGCAAALWAARAVAGVLADAVPARRIAGPLVAALLAGGVNVALVAGELHVRRDPTYHATMQPERDRQIALAMARWQAAQQARGVAPDAAAQAHEAATLERAHPRGFPFAWLLAAALAASALAGVWRARPGPGARPGGRLVAAAAIAAAAGLVLVIAIQLSIGT